MPIIKCPKCGSLVKYDNKSVWEGNRDFEEVLCPKCGEYLARVFTDGDPNPHLVDENGKIIDINWH